MTVYTLSTPAGGVLYLLKETTTMATITQQDQDSITINLGGDETITLRRENGTTTIESSIERDPTPTYFNGMIDGFESLLLALFAEQVEFWDAQLAAIQTTLDAIALHADLGEEDAADEDEEPEDLVAPPFTTTMLYMNVDGRCRRFDAIKQEIAESADWTWSDAVQLGGDNHIYFIDPHPMGGVVVRPSVDRTDRQLFAEWIEEHLETALDTDDEETAWLLIALAHAYTTQDSL